MGIDRPEDPDEPPDRPADHRDDQSGGGRAARAGGVQVETRPRQEYYVDLRVAASAEESVAAQQAVAKEQAAAQKWDESSKESRWMWSEYQRKWPPEERALAGKSGDQPGSWCGDGNGYLDRAENGRVEAECDRVTQREQGKISPAFRATESQDPDRHLIGFEYRLKGHDRIKEKVYDKMKEFGFSPEEAVS